MRRRTTRYGLVAVAAGVVAVLASACDEPVATTAGPDIVTPSFHVCLAGEKFTGGGRIDPPGVGKTTFGFNVHGADACADEGPIKGQLQVVHHPTRSRYHSTEITEFNSYASPEGGACGEWSGTVRAKHGNDAWHPHSFEVEACDNGEPGSSPGTGPDTFRATVRGHGTTGRTELTGGNIQAH